MDPVVAGCPYMVGGKIVMHAVRESCFFSETSASPSPGVNASGRKAGGHQKNFQIL